MSERSARVHRVVVVGAGLTGLTAAHRLIQRSGAPRTPLELTVLESRDRVGGAIWTDRVDGFTLEGGADSFITNKPQAVALCREIGLGDQLIGTDDRYRRSFVVRKGRLLPVPEGFVLMAPQRLGPLLGSPILSWRGKLRMLLDLLLPPRLDDADESLASFVRRRLGREALDHLVQPLVAGIYTADPEELSLRAAMPQFPQMEREHGSLLLAALRQGRAARQEGRGASGARYSLFQTIAGGMGVLPATLARSLPPGSVRLGASVRRISRQEAEGTWRVELLDGPPIEAHAVILAVEAHSAARLIDGEAPELALDLRSIPYASSAIVQLAYPRELVSHPLDGFGAVVPAVEGREILAISFTSVKFPGRAPEGSVLLRVFIGGALQASLFDRDDEELEAIARREVGELLGASGEPILCRVARHARAMPQYTLGHLDRVAAIRRRAASLPGLFLAGNAFSGVGVPDCIRSGQEAADATARLLADGQSRAVA
ncbi:protoporphyrinogen oxidase [Tautonia sociabilis]|uniref:protoporphyrinogen oxidase n=1 Tax=Tautonia sociabilis TaxID=2080755 RepID=UPI001F35B550|nr:protoporphyrinogen oxidase [Tautonia sociabilis]